MELKYYQLTENSIFLPEIIPALSYTNIERVLIEEKNPVILFVKDHYSEMYKLTKDRKNIYLILISDTLVDSDQIKYNLLTSPENNNNIIKLVLLLQQIVLSLGENIESYKQDLFVLESRLNDYMKNFTLSFINNLELKKENEISITRLNDYIEEFTKLFIENLESEQKSRNIEGKLYDFIGGFSNALIENLLDKQKIKKIKHYSSIDKLTGVLNKDSITECSKLCFEKSKNENFVYSVILLDIDDFKQVNDEKGHLIGDIVLSTVGNILKNNKVFRSCDYIGRYGGEEFLIILPSTSLNNCMYPAERLRHIIEKYDFKDDKEINFNITISIGISQSYIIDNKSVDIIKRADEALYESKGSGKNRISINELE